MKLFTKYLSVEGQIEMGDKFINMNDDETFMEIQENTVDNFLMDYADENWTENCKKVKLFLCTSDIQVGDKVWCEDVHNGNLVQPDKYIDPWRMRTETCTCKACIKVIGEVIIKGIKEGEEFSEEDIPRLIGENK